MTHDERDRAAAEARPSEDALRFGTIIVQQAERIHELAAEVDRLRAELTAAGEMGRELFQERNRALDALRRVAPIAENASGLTPEDESDIAAARAVLADHDREAAE